MCVYVGPQRRVSSADVRREVKRNCVAPSVCIVHTFFKCQIQKKLRDADARDLLETNNLCDSSSARPLLPNREKEKSTNIICCRCCVLHVPRHHSRLNKKKKKIGSTSENTKHDQENKYYKKQLRSKRRKEKHTHTRLATPRLRFTRSLASVRRNPCSSMVAAVPE